MQTVSVGIRKYFKMSSVDLFLTVQLACVIIISVNMPILATLKIIYRLGGVCSLANYSIAYEKTQSNRVSDFRDFVCSMFPKAILFDFYVISPAEMKPIIIPVSLRGLDCIPDKLSVSS